MQFEVQNMRISMEISDLRIVRPSSRSAAARSKSVEILIQRTYLRLEFQVNILGFRRMQKQQLSCDLRKTVIPSRHYDVARMRSVTSEAQINVSNRFRPIWLKTSIPLHRNNFPGAISTCRSADLNGPKKQFFPSISKALPAPAEAARCTAKVMWRQFLKIENFLSMFSLFTFHGSQRMNVLGASKKLAVKYTKITILLIARDWLHVRRSSSLLP